MEKPLVSIIIPVYNVSMYLRCCLNSVIMQTYENLEIILVDDGSTDDSGTICDEYAQSDMRIKVVHTENRGVSEARNKALEIAEGTYISFIDADDYVTSDFIERLYCELIRCDADISICAYEKIGGVSFKKKNKIPYANEKFILPINGLVDKEIVMFHCIDTNQFGCGLWNKLFKKSLLQGERLNRELLIGEDMVYLIQYILKSEKFCYVNKDMYKYRVNQNSALNQIGDDNYKKMASTLKSVKLVKFLTENENEKIRMYVAYKQVRSCLWVMFHMVLNHSFEVEFARDIKGNVKENYINYKKVNYGSKVQQLAVSCMKLSPKLLYIVGNIFLWIFPDKVYKMSRK